MDNRPAPDAETDDQPDHATACGAVRCSPPNDETTLAGLLALAGPDGADRLMAQIVTDLADVWQDMATALSSDDRDALRRATHVLVAVAGTIGAARLHRGAAALNTATHTADWTDVLRLSPPVIADLGALIDHLRRRTIGGAT